MSLSEFGISVQASEIQRLVALFVAERTALAPDHAARFAACMNEALRLSDLAVAKQSEQDLIDAWAQLWEGRELERRERPSGGTSPTILGEMERQYLRDARDSLGEVLTAVDVPEHARATLQIAHDRIDAVLGS